MPTCTEKNNNTSPTAASAGTDLNGAAAVDACRADQARLAEFAADSLRRRRRPGSSASADARPLRRRRRLDERAGTDSGSPSRQLVRRARRERVDLGARGFLRHAGRRLQPRDRAGDTVLLLHARRRVAEVAIDRFTGELRVAALDLLIDIGRSINPGVDRGQIIGGFIQGMGWVTAEELVYDDQAASCCRTRRRRTRFPTSPTCRAVFHVDLVRQQRQRRRLCAAKAVGEPPLMLGIAVWARSRTRSPIPLERRTADAARSPISLCRRRRRRSRSRPRGSAALSS